MALCGYILTLHIDDRLQMFRVRSQVVMPS